MGHKFIFTIGPTNPNFTIVDKEGKTCIWIQLEFSNFRLFVVFFSLFPCRNKSFKTFSWHLSSDNTANILTRRGGFSRREMSVYFLPVVISDNDYPIQSSTSTLIVRVCACDSHGNMQSCSPEVLPFSDGLTTGALVAILLCVIILLSKCTGFSISQAQKGSGGQSSGSEPDCKAKTSTLAHRNDPHLHRQPLVLSATH